VADWDLALLFASSRREVCWICVYLFVAGMSLDG
jgi:hypothetical protein